MTLDPQPAARPSPTPGRPAWAWPTAGAAAPAAAVVAARGVPSARDPAAPGAALTTGPVDRVYAVGEEVRFGPVGVTVTDAGVAAFSSETPGGGWSHHGPALHVHLRAANRDPSRTAYVRPRAARGRAVDGLGNRYPAVLPRDRVGGHATRVDGQLPVGSEAAIPPGAAEVDLAIVAPPAPAAGDLVFLLDARCYGRAGVARVRIPPAVWDPARRPPGPGAATAGSQGPRVEPPAPRGR